MISPTYSGFDSKVVFQQTNALKTLHNFNVDSKRNKLIIFSRVKPDKGLFVKENTSMMIFDMSSEETDYESSIHDKSLVDRLESGLYTFVEGHYYYSNNILKIRYDLILENT